MSELPEIALNALQAFEKQVGILLSEDLTMPDFQMKVDILETINDNEDGAFTKIRYTSDDGDDYCYLLFSVAPLSVEIKQKWQALNEAYTAEGRGDEGEDSEDDEQDDEDEN